MVPLNTVWLYKFLIVASDVSPKFVAYTSPMIFECMGVRTRERFFGTQKTHQKLFVFPSLSRACRLRAREIFSIGSAQTQPTIVVHLVEYLRYDRYSYIY